MPQQYDGPPIKVSYKNGKLRVRGTGGSIRVGGEELAKATQNCYNNLQCGDPNWNPASASGGEWSCNQQTGKCECEGNDCPPESTPTPTPEPTPGPGAWCVVKQCENGGVVNTGACSSGSWEAWKNADATGTAGGIYFGASCESINCEEEQCVTPTPEPTPSITPEPTPGPGAWCVINQCEDGNFVKTGACSSGSWEDWKNADAAGTAGSMSFGSSCESINCEEEQCVTPTPPTTYNVNMLFVTPTPNK